MKHIALFLVVTLFILIFPLSVASEGISFENGSFESELMFWDSAVRYDAYPFAGNYSLSIEPTPSDNALITSFKTNYQRTILLTSKKLYEISFYVRTDNNINSFSPNCKIDFSTAQKNVTISINNIPLSWQKVTGTFYVEKTDYYTFTIESVFQSPAATLHIDELSISLCDFKANELVIAGTTTPSVPNVGTATYSYIAAALDKENNIKPIQNGTITVKTPLPDGVSFNVNTGVLSVSTTAPEGSEIEFCLHIPGAITTSDVFSTAKLTKSVIENGSFNDMPLGKGWSIPTENYIKSSKDYYAEIETPLVKDGVHLGSFSAERALLLYANRLYVFRIKVRTDSLYTARNMGAQVLGPNESNLIRFQVANISGKEWNEVSAGFMVPADGVYYISLDLHSAYSASVFIDDISIQEESAAPVSVYLDTPMHVTRPITGETTIPLIATVLNQFGLPQSEDVTFSVEPENAYVRVISNQLYIDPLAICGEYVIVSRLRNNAGVQTRRTLLISDDSVYDGSFENSLAGQAWVTAEPSELHFVSTYKDIYPSDGKRLARLTMNGSVSMVMTDSVYSYSSEQSYVFEADMSMLAPDIETVVTIIVDNNESDSFDDNFIIGQFMLSATEKHISHLFSPTIPVTGRLMIAFNTADEHNQQIVFMDKISISVALVYASGVTISGSPFVDKNIVGNYRFSSNFNGIDASTYRWLIADSPNSIFMPIPGEKDNVLSVTAEMMNKYVKFEVTPISLSGPVVGESVSSAMILMGEPISSSSVNSPSVSPSPNVPSPSLPENSSEKTTPELHAMDIRPYAAAENAEYYDMFEHWAKNEVSVLTAAGIVEGLGNGFFEPQAPITRAEFAALLARAFQLAPMFYENTFSDVKSSNWFAGAVAVMTKHGITNGTSSLTFSPSLPITREEMAVMIMRAYRKTGALVPSPASPYADAASVSSWAYTDVLCLSSLGIMNGRADGYFIPKSNATRAEAAVVIKRMLTKINNNF